MTGDFCGDNYRTATPATHANASVATTVVVSGTTYTSGFAYLSYAGVTAYGCGTPKPAGVLPLPSAELFSYRGHAAAMPIAGDIHWPFNFADLAPNPVPWDAWISQELCYNHQHSPSCQTITQAAYRPYIPYHKAFFDLDPKWSKCGSGAFGIMDPPTALPRAMEIATPTMPTADSRPTSSARPGKDPSEGHLSPTTATPGRKPTHPSQPNPPDPEDPGRSHAAQETPNKQVPSKGHASRPSVVTTARPVDIPQDTAPEKDPEVSYTTKERTEGKTRIITTMIVPTSVLKQGVTTTIGTLPVIAASQEGALSIGTIVVSEGEATTIGKTFVSLGSETLVVGTIPPSQTSAQDQYGALSVLSAAQNEGKPFAEVTLNGEILTVYSGGMIIAPGTTTYVSPHAAGTVRGHIVSVGSDGGLVDSSSFRFASPTKGTTNDEPQTSAALSQAVSQTITAVYGHGTFRTTLLGHLGPSGHTLMTLGSGEFTYSGQNVVEDGTTLAAVLPHRGSDLETQSTFTAHSGHETALPPVVSAPQITTSAQSSRAQATPSDASESDSASTSNAPASFVLTPTFLSIIVALLSMRV
ncbi:hypothetical protein LTR37_007951 [Vermiconidia calcicola]|uniref:Uncharacterized protein n=1 Tax=Vermiconidia calcicola TaxID=1690605 RepID=A0ACC3NC07_9PEZI|nr:hypothetical protein LTR37_007951 [Vermiconidia calcicola]